MNRREALKNTGIAAGAGVLMPSFLFLLQSCKNEPKLGWQPQFLNIEEAKMLTALIDVILPKTDTPGGLDVNVDKFLDKVFAEMYDESAQQAVRKDMAAFNANCVEKFGNTFDQLDDQQQVTILKAEEANGGQFNPGVWGTAVGEQGPISFYRSLKSMMLWAYLSSEEIGKHVLNYDPIPAAYIGCMPLAEVGNKWSL
ncbi:MAG: gluconate 2-dehydrogenase subunit 3 family protein [Bacteroidota bacterium]